MFNNYYLLDYDFLRDLDRQRDKSFRVKITTLTWDELPIKSIEGEITGGTINIDGNSAVRRTCSLTMVAKDIDLENFYQGLNTKFSIEIGIGNSINAQYPSMIWIPQGIFILTSFNSSISVNNYTISLSGKDKMCLLNGDVSGALGASIDFGVEEFYDEEKQTTIYKNILLKDIIYNIVHVYGQESLEKISVNDLDMYGYSLMRYRGADNSPLYILINRNTNIINNITLNKNLPVYKNSSQVTISDDSIIYAQGVESQLKESNPTVITLKPEASNEKNNPEYIIRKIENGDTVGYRYTDLTYAGELISKPGESITSILDKIVKMLGNYEYFYDVNGHFIFQQKKNNLYNNWTPIVESNGENNLKEVFIDPLSSSLNYTFYGSDIFTSFSHNPDFMTIKNDYSIWGERTAVSGAKIPVHLRYAIHKKPKEYVSYEGKKYSVENYDWRELIYQMAKDHFENSQKEDFILRITNNNLNKYPGGRTGYEMFYVDLLSFWRDLYNPEEKTDLYGYWNKTIYESPTSLNFWFDFLGENTLLDKYSIPAIGDRAKVINDNSVSAIYFKETPDILLWYGDEDGTGDDNRNFQISEGYTRINIPQYLQNSFNMSERRKSAFEVLEQVLYENTQSKESVNINAIPIYYLQPNTRIGISNDNSDIHGEFIVSKITLPLTHNGIMQLTATRAIDTNF